MRTRPSKPRPPKAAGTALPLPLRTKPVRIDLALQGGGSHGAFTWGVLDRLLDDETLSFDGVCGTSAGALNAAVLATGMAEGGHAGAQAALRAFWLDVSAQGACFGRWPGAASGAGFGSAPGAAPGIGNFNLDSHPFYAWGKLLWRSFNPYQFNPFNPSGDNPLRAVLLRHVKPQVLKSGPLSVFVVATSVRTGQPRIFDHHDLSIDALLASACLPQIFRAVDIDGQPYWDGGYSGNPALWPLIYNTDAMDILLVKVNPLLRPDLPDTPEEISDRVNEITFNAGLIGEMRAIDFVQRLIAKGQLQAGHYKNLRLHMVADEVGLAPLNASSKLNTDRAFVEALHSLGRAAADAWWLAHRADLGKQSTLDIRKTFLQPLD
jgi:NTE family protein